MAIYKGREVQVIGEVSKGYTTPETVQIFFDNTYENVKIGDLKVTEDEKKTLQKAQADKFENITVVSDKEVQELRDSQDPEKIAKLNEKQNAPQDVTIKAQGAQVSTPTGVKK